MKTQRSHHLIISCSFSLLGLWLLLAVISSRALFAQVSNQIGARSIYLPAITNAAVDTNHCLPNADAASLAELMGSDPGQKRTGLLCNPLLEQVAQERAWDMAVRAYVSHVNPDGYGPNYLVRQAGYILPEYYGQARTDNNIESIAAGYSNAGEAWAGLLNSAPHRMHVLGTDQFYAAQVEYGIGCVHLEDSPHGYYWVIITARPGP